MFTQSQLYPKTLYKQSIQDTDAFFVGKCHHLWCQVFFWYSSYSYFHYHELYHGIFTVWFSSKNHDIGGNYRLWFSFWLSEHYCSSRGHLLMIMQLTRRLYYCIIITGEGVCGINSRLFSVKWFDKLNTFIPFKSSWINPYTIYHLSFIIYHDVCNALLLSDFIPKHCNEIWYDCQSGNLIVMIEYQ